MTSFSVAGETSILPTNGKKGVIIFTSSDPMPEKFNMPEITLGTIKAADGKTDLYYSTMHADGTCIWLRKDM